MKKLGFTILELIVALGVLAIVLTVGINVFFQIIQATNQATTQNELRQNANLVMEQIGRRVRSGACLMVNVTNKTLSIYPSKLASGVCDGAPITFAMDATNNCISESSACITSNKIRPTNFILSSNTYSNSVTVNLTLESTGTRTDTSGQITQTQTFSLRDYNY